MNVANHCPNLVILECAGLSLLTDAGFIVSVDILIWFLLRLDLMICVRLSPDLATSWSGWIWRSVSSSLTTPSPR